MAATSANTSNASSARNSVSSTASDKHIQQKSVWQRILTELKPLETPEEPIGIFQDLRPRKHSKPSDPKESMSRRASVAYNKFKDTVGGEKVYFYH